MPSYDGSQFDPPAPVARVTLRNPDSGAMVPDSLLLLDTGADITLLPRTVVERLGISPLPDVRYELIGFDGNKSSAPAVMVDLIFIGRAFRGRYLLIDAEHGLLGRDVLNHLPLLFDGPGQRWSEHVP